MPDMKCDVAIIGGGIIGTSIAFHLAKAAGGIRAQFGSDINVQLSKMSIGEFETFGRDVGIQVDFNQVGYLWIATKADEMRLFEKNVALQRSRGLDVLLLGRDDVARRAPYVRIDDVAGGTFHQKDGYAPPADYVMGYHKASKDFGVKYLLGTEVTGVLVKEGVAQGLRTSQGEIAAKTVVCAAGAWAGQFGGMLGLEIPIRPVRRQCFVTEPIRDGLPHPIPMTIDYTSGVYIHSESGGVLAGLADKEEPSSFNQNVDYAFIERIAELAMHRIPRLETATVRTSWAGLYEVTDDDHPILGPLPGLSGFLLAAGFSGHGVMHAPATGRLMTELILTGKTSIDLRPLRCSRFRERDLVRETHVI